MPESPFAKGLPALNYHQRAQMTRRHAFSLHFGSCHENVTQVAENGGKSAANDNK
jgi:hypothetical protein